MADTEFSDLMALKEAVKENVQLRETQLKFRLVELDAKMQEWNATKCDITPLSVLQLENGTTFINFCFHPSPKLVKARDYRLECKQPQISFTFKTPAAAAAAVESLNFQSTEGQAKMQIEPGTDNLFLLTANIQWIVPRGK